MSKDKSWLDKVMDKASKALTGTGDDYSADRARKDIENHYNEIDEINRQLEDTSPDDTATMKKIFDN